jgi:gamma-glutamyltranspeptidase / glutathione hydrolase
MKAAYLTGAAALLIASSVAAADLSPGSWPAAERAQLEQGDFGTFPQRARTVSAGTVLVTATLSPISVHAGIEALRQGGTAADAAATVALTQIATDLGAVVSYAGVLRLLYFDAATHRVYDLDAGWGSYAHETDPAGIAPTDLSLVTGQPVERGVGMNALGRQTLVGGFMAGIEAMHSRFGRLTFADLFQPAIWYAEHGVRISPALAAYFRLRQAQLWRTPEGRRFASLPVGRLPKTGDLFRQYDLARTLKAIAADGTPYMYAGDWARSFVRAIRAQGGRVTLDDLAHYKPAWRDALRVSFADATVYGPGEDPSGSCPALEALNLLSGLHVESRGPYWRDAESFRAYVHALRFALYAHYLPQVAAFETANGFAHDCRARLTSQYAATVDSHLATLLGAPEAAVAGAAGHHTEAVIVVDRWGNVAALVHSINTVIWGDTGIVVGGIPIADAAAINRRELMNVKPGGAVPNGMSPLIALKGGLPILAVASVGSSLTPETTRLVGGVLAGHENLQSLMSAPPLLLNLSPFEVGQTLISRPEAIPVGAYDAKMRQAIAALGVPVQEESLQRMQATRGTAVVAVVDRPGASPLAVEVTNVFGFAESAP